MFVFGWSRFDAAARKDAVERFPFFLSSGELSRRGFLVSLLPPPRWPEIEASGCRDARGGASRPVLVFVSSSLTAGSIFLSGPLRQLGGVDWCPFRSPDPSPPFMSTPPYSSPHPSLSLPNALSLSIPFDSRTFFFHWTPCRLSSPTVAFSKTRVGTIVGL